MNKESKSYKIQLNNKTFHIPKYFRRIGEVSENIYMELTEKGLYHVQSSVQSEILQSFLDYWQSNTLPNVNASNFWQYYLLSHEFGMMSAYLESPEFSQISKLEYLRNATPSSSSTDRSNSEKKISEDLDYYITNYEDELFSLPITSLTNIFSCESRSLTNYNQIYEIIQRRAQNRPELFVLLETFKMSDLSDTLAADAFIHMNERLGFIPKITPDLVEKHVNVKNELKKTKEEFRKEKYELFQKFISEKIELNRQIHQLNDQITMIKDKQKDEKNNFTYKSRRNRTIDVVYVVDALNLVGDDLNAALDRVEDKAFNLQIDNRTAFFKHALIFYKNTVEFPGHWPRIFDFDEDIEKLAIFGEDFVQNQEVTDVCDSTCDFASSLYHAVNDLSWRDGDKLIYWIASGPAYGEFFGGKSGFKEEENKLKNLVARIARDGFVFDAIYMNEEAKQTFLKMKEIYDANNGSMFKITKFEAEVNDEAYPSSDPLMDGDFRLVKNYYEFKNHNK